MRVVRIKHKTGIALVVIVCVIALLLLISRKSHSEIAFERDTFPTRSVDFINIANQATVSVIKDNNKHVGSKSSLDTRVRMRGKSRTGLRKVPRPPKRRIADGIVDRKVMKDVVHGDNQNGVRGRNNRVQHQQQQYHKPKTNHKPKDKQVSPPTKLSKSSSSSYTIAVLVIACNRPDAVKRCLNGLLKYRPSAKQFPIIVSQDCGHEETSQAISTYGNQVQHIKQPDLSDIYVPPNMRRFQGYYKISRHFKWALGQLFDGMYFDTVLIVEDDLDIAPDFYDYFLATRKLLDQDPSIWCVSAWNDNGKGGMINATKNDLLYRSDFFPGLGWMMTKSLWNELKGKWPAGFWDDWMRESAQRKGRACIRPEISRTKTFGRIGVSQGQFYEQHLKYIMLNNKKYDFLKDDLSYLIKENYDKSLFKKMAALPVFSIEDIQEVNTKGHKAVRVNYSKERDFSSLAFKLGAMADFKAGIPRTGYLGIVTVLFKDIRVFITPKETKK